MKHLITIYQFIVKRWDRIRQAANLVFGLGQELSQELRQAEVQLEEKDQ